MQARTQGSAGSQPSPAARRCESAIRHGLRTAASPPGTLVVAEIPNLFGPGLTAQMTYYETPAGAKVFAAGALDFGGSAATWPTRRILQNLYDRLSVP